MNQREIEKIQELKDGYTNELEEVRKQLNLAKERIQALQVFIRDNQFKEREIIGQIDAYSKVISLSKT